MLDCARREQFIKASSKWKRRTIKFQFIANYPQVRAAQSSATGNKLKIGGALNRWQLDSGIWVSEPEEGWWLLKQRAFGDDRHKCGINKTPCCKDPPLPIDKDAEVNNMCKGKLGAFPWETWCVLWAWRPNSTRKLQRKATYLNVGESRPCSKFGNGNTVNGGKISEHSIEQTWQILINLGELATFMNKLGQAERLWLLN